MQNSVLDFQVTVPILGAGSLLFTGPHQRDNKEHWTEPERLDKGLDIRFSVTAAGKLVNRIRKGEFARLEWARLAWMDHALYSSRPHDLITPHYLKDQWRRVGVIPYPHQLDTARKVIDELGGRAILADEVGLGKTIEAGIILREYMLRRQVQRVLILCPAALIWQWYQELKEKFLISALLQRSEYDWERTDVIIASLDTAKKEPHANIIHSLDYDMLIVDEAHRLKNDRTSNYRFVRQIKKTFCLMLTATPVQNDLRELYNLVTLTSPGILGSRAAFRNQYMIDKRNPSDPEGLRERVKRVIIRNRRGPDTVEMTARRVESIKCQLTPEERDLYDSLATLSNMNLSDKPGAAIASALSLITLQREVCSSSPACLVTLHRILEQTRDERVKRALTRLIAKAEAVRTHAKVEQALDLIGRIDDRVIIFTEYRATQQYLLHRLEQRGILALGFDGSLSSSRKEWIKELFRRYAQVLVSTESGGEGLNFQFCSHLINFDLPWNPMKVEQRIGRIHRLGQTRDVHVYNIVTENTIEEYILYLLYEKIRLFEMAVGELDDILSHVDVGANDLEKELATILSQAQSPGEIRARLDELVVRLDTARAKKEGQDRLSIDSLLSD